MKAQAKKLNRTDRKVKNDKRYHAGTVLSGGFKNPQIRSQKQNHRHIRIYHHLVFGEGFSRLCHSNSFSWYSHFPFTRTFEIYFQRAEADFLHNHIYIYSEYVHDKG